MTVGNAYLAFGYFQGGDTFGVTRILANTTTVASTKIWNHFGSWPLNQPAVATVGTNVAVILVRETLGAGLDTNIKAKVQVF